MDDMEPVPGGVPAQAHSPDQGRRAFVRQVGGALFAILVVDVADPARALASSGCGGGTPDSACDEGSCYFDSHDQDDNCGQTITGTSNVDPDDSCSATEKDDSCTITQLPSPGKEPDAQCENLNQADPDQSCGDCDDNHEVDEHCGVKSGSTYDADGLCGHQSGCPFPLNSGDWTQFDPDDVCGRSAGGGQIEPDVGCGLHNAGYGNTNGTADQDQSCGTAKVGGGENPDMNCNNAPGESADQYCNTSGNASTTSPDEHCGDPPSGGNLTDRDQACSHYDADEGCGRSLAAGGAEPDEACGRYPIDYLPTETDADQHCPGGNDPANPAGDADDSDENNTAWPIPKSTPPVNT